jgi:putative ABC transport system substrate-binding protein
MAISATLRTPSLPINALTCARYDAVGLESGMSRRNFFGIIGGAILAWPLTARAQPRLPIIGVLVPANPEPFWTKMREGLRELGYVEGKNVRFEFRTADGKPDLLNGLAEELVRLNVDLIVVWQTPAAFAARKATTALPIVMASVADPVGTGLVASLARPGGNITGFSGTTAELGAKILELIREMMPSARRAGLLVNATDPFSKIFVEQVERGGRTLGITIQPIIVDGADGFEAAIAAMARERADAVIVQPSLPHKTAVDLALKYRLPSISPSRFFTGAGGLISYSADQTEIYRSVAQYVDRILKGAKPSELPVLQPTRYELIINLKTANALGIVLPPTFVTRADEVIE